jgi:hypothetical protein
VHYETLGCVSKTRWSLGPASSMSGGLI